MINGLIDYTTNGNIAKELIPRLMPYFVFRVLCHVLKSFQTDNAAADAAPLDKGKEDVCAGTWRILSINDRKRNDLFCQTGQR